MSFDLEHVLAEDWRRIRAIEAADADLSAAQEDLLETCARRLSKDRPLSRDQRVALNSIYENLAELVKRD